jgi:hypothetical protein
MAVWVILSAGLLAYLIQTIPRQMKNISGRLHSISNQGIRIAKNPATPFLLLGNYQY